MLYGKMAKQFMEEHIKKMGPPQPTEKERVEAERPQPPTKDTVPEWLGASPHYKPKKEKPKPPPTALGVRGKGSPATSTAEYD